MKTVFCQDASLTGSGLSGASQQPGLAPARSLWDQKQQSQKVSCRSL